MMRHVALAEVVELHRRLHETPGGTSCVPDCGALESAVAQPEVTFGGVDLYAARAERAAALGASLVHGHPFADGNKRVGQAAMDAVLALSGTEIDLPIDDQGRLIVDLATARLDRTQLTDWLRQHLEPLA